MSKELSVTTVSLIDGLDFENWDAMLGPGGFYMSQRWLRVAETHATFRASYVLARDSSGALLGALPAYVTEASPPDRRYAVDIELADAAPGVDRWFPGLLLGGRAGYLTQFPLAGTRGSQVRSRLLKALVDKAGGSFQTTVGAAALYLDGQSLAELIDAVPNRVPVLSAADAVLELEVASFDEYLSMLSKKRRRTVRDDIRRFAASGLVVEQVAFSEVHQELAGILAKHNGRFGANSSVELLSRHLARQAEIFGDDPLCLVVRVGGDIVAFSLSYQWQDELYLRIVGIDHDRLPDDTRAYFTLAFYEPIRFAIKNGLSRIRLGLESSGAKVLRGAQVEPRWSMILKSESDDSRTATQGRNEAVLDAFDQAFGNVAEAMSETTWPRDQWAKLGWLPPFDDAIRENAQ